LTAWGELSSRGFVHVPRFFGDDDLNLLRRDFADGSPPSEYDLGYKPIAPEVLAALEPRIAETLARVREETDSEVDALLNGFYFATAFAQKTKHWHQDYDAYYRLSRDHVNYVNLYVPITKPERDRSNVELVPFDRLRERAPELFEHLKGGGANFVVPRPHRVIVENPDTRTKTTFQLECELDELAVTPALSEGDLLLFRGDVLHKSQDLDTERVAASMRAGRSAYGYRPHTELRWFREGRKDP
jgi:ectoine hydroxylase-related dioxygenase (phytanoyl-CoA dioxygenase family)